MAANTFPSRAAAGAAGGVKLTCGVEGAAGREYAAGGVMGTDWPLREITGRVDRLMSVSYTHLTLPTKA